MSRIPLVIFLLLTVCIIISFITTIFATKPSFTNPDVISYLKSIPKGILTINTLAIVTKQKIIYIDTKEGIIPNTKIPYIFILTLTPTNKKPSVVYFINPNTPILIQDSQEYKKGKISDLQIGQTILLERFYSGTTLKTDDAATKIMIQSK